MVCSAAQTYCLTCEICLVHDIIGYFPEPSLLEGMIWKASRASSISATLVHTVIDNIGRYGLMTVLFSKCRK
jgi:hypothetical protein